MQLSEYPILRETDSSITRLQEAYTSFLRLHKWIKACEHLDWTQKYQTLACSAHLGTKIEQIILVVKNKAIILISVPSFIPLIPVIRIFDTSYLHLRG